MLQGHSKATFSPIIQPAKLEEEPFDFIGILEMVHSPEGKSYRQHDITAENLLLCSKEVRIILKAFSMPAISAKLEDMQKQFRKERSGLGWEQHQRKALYHLLHETVLNLLMPLQSLKLYHKILDPLTKRYRVGLAGIKQETPALSFRVSADERGALTIEPVFEISGEQKLADQYNLHHFLLGVSDDYYILNKQDYTILQWLQSRNPQQFARKPRELLKHIVMRLEEKYQVARNDHFPVIRIESPPCPAILLSEISGSFIMITPQWNYEGLMIEGKYAEKQTLHIDGEVYEVLRDKTAEDALVNELKMAHPSFAKQINGYFYLSFEEAKKKQWFLKQLHHWLETDIELRGLDMLKHFRYSPHPVSTEKRLEEVNDTSAVIYLRVSFGQQEVSLKELRKLILNDQHHVLLKDDSMGVLTDEWLAQYAHLLRHGTIQNNHVSVPKWIFVIEGHQHSEELFRPVIPDQWWQRWTAWQKDELTLISTSETFQASLRPYQQKGFEWMVLLSEIGAGACLSDDMGLGKTLQTLAFITHRLQERSQARTLIICPSSLMYNWKNEIQRFAPELQVYMYHQSARKLDEFLSASFQVLISSYGTVRSDVELLKLVAWDTIVLDESHQIKNSTSLAGRAVQQLSAPCRIALSGTPVMNHTLDLFTQVNFALPGYLGSYEFFKKEYADPIDRGRDQRKVAQLQKMIAPFVLRRTKAQVAEDLPEKVESVIWCQMEDEQRMAYESVKEQIRGSIFLGIKQEGFKKQTFSILQGIQKLRQLCTVPQLMKDLEMPCRASVKLEILREELGRLGRHKALIFSQYLGMLDLIAQLCDNEGLMYFRIDGSTPAADRQLMVDAFQEPESHVQVFLLSLKAGNAGLTLTAADYVFLADPWWNNAVQQQAIDRTHRIGQDKQIFAYKLICKDSIEERILELQQRKRQLSEHLITEEEGFAKQLTEEDIAFLFQ